MQVTLYSHQFHPVRVHRNLWSDLHHAQTKLYGCILVVIIVALALWQPWLGIKYSQRINSCCGWLSMVCALLQASGMPALL